PFLDLALQAARAEDPTPTTFEPGEITTLQLPAAARISNVQESLQPSRLRQVVVRDDGREVSRADAEQDRAQLRLPDQPGLYTLTYDDDETIQKIFSINPSPRESQLTYVQAPQVLSTWHFEQAGKTPKSASANTAARINLASVLQQRFWWWLILGGV